MKKAKSGYRCQNCGYFSTKWLGKCPECGSWNSFSESQFLESTTNNHLTKPSNLKVFTLAEINQQLTLDSAITIYPFQNSQLNHFWGGGIVSGSLSLLAGEPGLGKSTLALQLLRSLFQANLQAGLKLFYVTAEEALTELARRSQRLGIPQEILLFQGNQFEDILQVLQTYQPQVMVIDSIQTIFTNQLENSPGSVSQVAFLANQFLSISKAQNISFILIGHITKDGQIAGPKTLEHLVDSVLVLEAAKNTNYRTLSFSKHRFGSTEEILLLKMETAGLQIVADPSLALLENLETGVGIVYGIAMDKNLPLIVEIQALVSTGNYSDHSFGRREGINLNNSKLNTILAIAEKYLNLKLKNLDVYVQISGLPKAITDDSLDLPILLAILSSLYSKPIQVLLNLDKKLNPQKIAFAGRLTLSGKIRQATSLDRRTSIAKNLGFLFNPNITIGNLDNLTFS